MLDYGLTRCASGITPEEVAEFVDSTQEAPKGKEMVDDALQDGAYSLYLQWKAVRGSKSMVKLYYKERIKARDYLNYLNYFVGADCRLAALDLSTYHLLHSNPGAVTLCHSKCCATQIVTTKRSSRLKTRARKTRTITRFTITTACSSRLSFLCCDVLSWTHPTCVIHACMCIHSCTYE